MAACQTATDKWKRRYPNYTGAIAAAKALSTDLVTLAVYQCMTCGDYHLTSQPVTSTGLDTRSPRRRKTWPEPEREG